MIKKEEIKRILLANREILEKYRVKSVSLFGSYVRNEQKEDSDIDLLVEFKEDTYRNFINLIFALEDLFKKRVTVVSEKDLSPYIQPYVLKEAEKMVLDEKYKDFIIAWQERIRRQNAEREETTKEAKEYAVKSARLLIEEFGAKRVFLFGSLKDGYFHKDSDIDLAVEGLPVSLYFKALAAVHRISDGFRVELTPCEDCLFKESILKEGELLHELS